MNVYPYNPVTVGSAMFNPYVPQPVYNPTIPQTAPVVAPQGPRMQIDTVNGKESAMAYNIGPNSSVILADSSLPKIWIVTTDSSGYKAVKGFTITPDEEENAVKAESVSDDRLNSLEMRLKELEERINSYGQSNIKPSGQNKSGNAGAQPNDRNGSGGKGSNGGDQSNVRQ